MSKVTEQSGEHSGPRRVRDMYAGSDQPVLVEGFRNRATTPGAPAPLHPLRRPEPARTPNIAAVSMCGTAPTSPDPHPPMTTTSRNAASASESASSSEAPEPLRT